MTLTLSLIGRPNVGKSSLFNRLVGRRASLVHDEPGLTRDRIYGDASFDEREFLLIDTGGLELESSEGLMPFIKRQADIAIEESDIILFLVDGRAGLLPADREIAQLLRRSKKPVYLVVNKTETTAAQQSAPEFYGLGFENVFPVSAAHGLGLNDLFETLFAAFPLPPEEIVAEEEGAEPILPLAIIGRPNAGKSSFMNKLLGEERFLVSPEAGTTMDAVDEEIGYAGHRYRLIDTAGIRRKRSISKDTEKMAVSASLGGLDRSQVALMLIDATAGLTEQDLKVASFIHKKAKAVVIVVNKWDLAKDKELKAEPFAQHIRDKMPFLADAPIKFVSALTGSRVFDVLETAWEVFEAYTQRVPTSQVNRMLERAVAAHAPPIVRGKRLKFYYGTQVSVAPPTFLFTMNEKEELHFSYERFLINRIREEFGFKGSPIRLVFRARS
ncbi:MAG: ribosome biogenesis GTPase Der [Myxococcota bacterium]